MTAQPDPNIHPSLLVRKILHIDMDAFYASVEIRDNPSLQGLPVIVGGSPQSRGVVSTASYPARKFGVRSAMACSVAARLCPQAIFIRPNFEKYTAVAKQLREIFSIYTPLVEPMSLDEAYLDVTQNAKGLYAVQIAKEIREIIFKETRLTASAGVAPNKLVAKIASDVNKPNGITVVQPHQVLGFMAELSLRKIPGVGPVTEKDFLSKGLVKCKDIWALDDERLESLIGNRAEWMKRASRGIDESPVETSWERKSLGEEETFAKDVSDTKEMKNILSRISDSVFTYAKDQGHRARTIQLKVKYANFQTITRRRSYSSYVDSSDQMRNTVHELLDLTEVKTRPVRLLGVSLSNFVE